MGHYCWAWNHANVSCRDKLPDIRRLPHRIAAHPTALPQAGEESLADEVCGALVTLATLLCKCKANLTFSVAWINNGNQEIKHI